MASLRNSLKLTSHAGHILLTISCLNFETAESKHEYERKTIASRYWKSELIQIHSIYKLLFKGGTPNMISD